MSYSTVHLKISSYQKKKIHEAVGLRTGVSVKLEHSDLTGSDSLIVPNRMAAKIEKHKAAGKGIILYLSADAVKRNKEIAGGWLLPVISGLAGALLPGLLGGSSGSGMKGGAIDGIATGVDSDDETLGQGLKKKGQGMYTPGFSGVSGVPKASDSAVGRATAAAAVAAKSQGSGMYTPGFSGVSGVPRVHGASIKKKAKK